MTDDYLQFKVQYRVNPDDILQTIGSMKVKDLETLHRAMIGLTGTVKPMQHWDEFHAHQVADGKVLEYGKLFLGALYDMNYEYKPDGGQAKPKERPEMPAFFIKGLTPITRSIRTNKAASIYDSTYFNYFKE